MFVKGNFLDTYSSLIHVFLRNYEEKYKKNLYLKYVKLCVLIMLISDDRIRGKTWFLNT